jgi:hypothetical protein
MVSKTPKQKRFMRIAAHDPAFAKEAGIPVSVAREFYAADQRKGRREAVKKAFNKVKSR